MRADELLVFKSLAESRNKARAIIEEGKLRANGVVVDKPSRKLPDNAVLEISQDADSVKYVSRAGLKLEGFLKKYPIDLKDSIILDAGASTGGFTDCSLSLGAKKAICVDVGHGQLHRKLLEDSRVVNMEKTDVRNLTPATFNGELFDFICADLSFISLEKVFGTLWNLLKSDGNIVCLVKPQFETAPNIMRKNKGVLRDKSLRLEALEKIKSHVKQFSDAEFIGQTESSIAGSDGNLEYLIGYKKQKSEKL